VENGADTTIKLTVAYDGTRFKGWQKGNGRTVQDVLEEALAASIGTASGGAARAPDGFSIVGAGRTDAGVHAEGQVASAVFPSSVDPILLVRAVNERLPQDVSVLSAERAGDRFHARYKATAKTYRYRIVSGDAANPFLFRYSWFLKGLLDEEAMRAAARCLEGRRDFSAFTADKGKKDKTRSIHSIRFEHPRLFGTETVDLLFRGDGFLWNQVRIMAAALAAAGRGELRPADLEALLASRDRSRAPAPAPACGLSLVSVEYADA